VDGKDDKTSKYGWYVLGGYTINPRLQAVAKFDRLDPNRGAAGDRSDVTTLGVNWFLNLAVKLQLNYERHEGQSKVTSSDLFLSQFQVRY
jgi:phosphate-selective porin